MGSNAATAAALAAEGLDDGYVSRAGLRQRLPGYAAIAVAAIAALWVLVFATGTSAGSLVREPGEFITTLLDGLTYSGLLFVVASGFTLIFGLMRTVNMAHGSFFLLAAYIAVEVQQKMVGKTANIDVDEVSIAAWLVPALVGAVVVAVIGLIMHQLLLRWNQGQDLRQALISLAVSVILADQMIANFGGIAQKVTWPGATTKFFEIFGSRYASSRLVMLAIGLLVLAGLWLWLNRTRMGIIVRAGVDDQDMVRALGVNITLVFAVVFFVGSFLGGLGGVMGGSFSGAGPGTDGQWLLNSLVVVIIGGLGSIRGAVAGSLLYGMVVAFAPAYLPSAYTYYAIILTFVLLAIVLAVRPYGLFGTES